MTVYIFTGMEICEELVPIRLSEAITDNCETSCGLWDPT